MANRKYLPSGPQNIVSGLSDTIERQARGRNLEYWRGDRTLASVGQLVDPPVSRQQLQKWEQGGCSSGPYTLILSAIDVPKQDAEARLDIEREVITTQVCLSAGVAKPDPK
jgi:hypothetical protein